MHKHLKTKVGIVVATGALLLASGAAALTIIGTPGDDNIVGSPDNDRIAARAGDDTVHSRGGHDVVVAGRGNDTVDGGFAADALFGRSGDDTVDGGPGNDLIGVGVGVDTEYGGVGNDRMWALAKADVPLEGVDTVDAGPGNDRIHTRDGEADNVTCGDGRDRAKLDNVDVITDATPENPNGSCERVERADPTGEPEPGRHL